MFFTLQVRWIRWNHTAIGAHMVICDGDHMWCCCCTKCQNFIECTKMTSLWRCNMWSTQHTSVSTSNSSRVTSFHTQTSLIMRTGGLYNYSHTHPVKCLFWVHKRKRNQNLQFLREMHFWLFFCKSKTILCIGQIKTYINVEALTYLVVNLTLLYHNHLAVFTWCNFTFY